MKPFPSSRQAQSILCSKLRNVAALSISTALAISGAQAASGTWTQITAGNASGTWSDALTANWASGVVADGSGFTADFSTLDITATSTITLGAPRTIGNLIFGDITTATAGGWTLTGSTLTLAGATPTITVNPLGTSSLVRIESVLSGTSGLTKAGTGILLLVGANDYSGGTTISEGSVRAAVNSALGSGAVTVASGAALQLQNSITLANTVNLNGTGSGSTNRAISLIGGAPVLSGLVNVQSNSTIGMGSAASASLEMSGTLNLGANQLTVEGSRPLTLSGAIVGTGNLNLANISGTTIITNDNSTTFSGTVFVSRSTLAVGHNGALGTGTLAFGVNDQASTVRSTDTTTRTLANAVALVGTTNSTFNFGSTTPSLNGNLTFTNTTGIALGSQVKKFQVHNRTQFDAGFTGNSGITMQVGTGTLVLNGSSSYTGATTVNAGTLLIDGSLGSSAVTVSGTGVPSATLGGEGTIGGDTTLGGNSFLTPGEDGIANVLTFGSSLDVAGITTGTGALKFDLGTTSDMVTLTTGALTIGSGLLEWDDFDFTAMSGFGDVASYTLISTTQAISGTLGTNLSGTIDGFSATISIADGGTDLILTVVPEPAVSVLVGAGLMTVLFLRRRQGRA